MPYVDVDKLIAYFQGEWDWHDCECVRQFTEDGEFEPVIHAQMVRYEDVWDKFDGEWKKIECYVEFKNWKDDESENI